MRLLLLTLALCLSHIVTAQTDCDDLNTELAAINAQLSKITIDPGRLFRRINGSRVLARGCGSGESKVDAALARLVQRLRDQTTRAEALQRKAEEAEEIAKKALADAEEARRRNEEIVSRLFFYRDRFGLFTNGEERNPKYGFMNRSLDTLIDFKYDEALPFDYTGYARVKRDDGYFLIDTFGTEYTYVNDVDDVKRSPQALDLRDYAIQDNFNLLTEREELRDLEILIIDGTRTFDLEGISNFKNLRALFAGGNLLDDLPDLSALTKLERLDLDHQGVRKVPGLGKLTKLKVLLLQDNYLDTLPDLSQLPDLVHLELDDNQLEELPGISSLSKLRVFSAANNLLEGPLDLSNNTLLEEIDLKDNRLRSLPRLPNGTALRTVQFNNNQIDDFRPLERYPNLTAIDLDKTGAIYLPDFRKFSRLDLVSLQGLKLSEMPDLSGLNELEKIFLSDNPIRQAPDLTGLPNLITLVMENCLLEEFPRFAETKKIKGLALDRNLIKVLPANPELENLEVLNLAQNRIETVEDIYFFTSLRQLDLDSNRVRRMPDLRNLRNLTQLSITGNGLEVFPDVRGLKKLKRLRVGENKNLPLPTSWDNPVLELLDVNENGLADLNGLDVLPLQRLYAMRNNLQDIDLLPQIKTLTHIYLDGNDIRKLPDFSGSDILEQIHLAKSRLTELPVAHLPLSLEAIDVSGNPFTTPMPDLTTLENLKVIFMKNTSWYDLPDSEQEALLPEGAEVR